MTTNPGKYIMRVYRGATFRKVITWKDESNTIVNVTGFKARLHMRETVESSAPFLTLTTENGGITLGGAAGTITLQASATATAALTVLEGVYDLEMVAQDNVTITRLLEGLVFVSPEVTR